jgi:hypothetical protein
LEELASFFRTDLEKASGTHLCVRYVAIAARSEVLSPEANQFWLSSPSRNCIGSSLPAHTSHLPAYETEP